MELSFLSWVDYSLLEVIKQKAAQCTKKELISPSKKLCKRVGKEVERERVSAQIVIKISYLV